jgi:fructoselysine-6-P-deglycase FrlB-like protein
MSMIEQELRSQPGVWLAARKLADTVSDQLPAKGDRVAIVGCGTSLYMAQAAARWREAAGHGETDAFAASEFPRNRSYDVYVAVSRSGTTTEVLELLEQLEGRRSLLLTADPAQPASGLASSTIGLAFADEESVVQTRFATGWLALWRAHIGHNVDDLARDGWEALTAQLPAALSSFRQFVFLGRGPAAGIASEAALKPREAAGCWTEAYPSMEFRHGPISGVGPHTLVWSLDHLDDVLSNDVTATGATVVASVYDPMVELVRVQRAAVQLALANGLDPDRPRHLSRSVILSAGSSARAGASGG